LIKNKIVKKIIIAISLISIIFQTSCSNNSVNEKKEVRYKSSNLEERDTEYKDGYYTENMYVNESVGIKFKRPKGFKFINTDNELDTDTKDSKEKEGIKIEALCKGAGTNITFLSCKIEKEVSMDIASNEFLNGIDSVDSRKVDLENVHDQKREDVVIAGKYYRLLELSADKNDNGMLMTCFLRIVGDYLFVIEVADVSQVSTLKNGVVDIIKSVEKIGKNDDLNLIKKQAKTYRNRILLEEKRQEHDPCIEKKEGVYGEGVMDYDVYKNEWAGFMFQLPNFAEYTSMKEKSEMEATSKNLFCCTYVTSEYIGKNYTMEEYIRNISGVSKKMTLRVINNKRKEKFINKWWRVISLDTGKKSADGKRILQKIYTRFVGTQAIQISFIYIQGQEKAVTNMKKAYGLL